MLLVFCITIGMLIVFCITSRILVVLSIFHLHRHIRISNLVLTDESSLFFTDTTYVPGQFFSYIFCHKKNDMLELIFFTLIL